MKRIGYVIFIPLAFIAFSSLSGQANYREGYVVTNEQDTLHGYIKDFGGSKNTSLCIFKEERKSAPVYYGPDQLEEYRMYDSKYFRSGYYFRKGLIEKAFAEVLVDGEVSLYYYRKNKEMSYYLEMEDKQPVGLINKVFTIKPVSTEGSYYYNQKFEVRIPIYQDTLRSLFKESKNIQQMAGNVHYSHPSLMSVTRAYLEETCEGKNCISYEKDLGRFRDRFGLYAGVQEVRSGEIEDTLTYRYNLSYSIGMFAQIPMPLTNEHTFIQIELNYKRFDYNAYITFDDRFFELPYGEHMIGIPILVKYRFLYNKLSPTLSLGKEFGIYYDAALNDLPSNLNKITSHSGSWIADLGVEYEISSGMMFFSRIRFQRNMRKTKPEFQTYIPNQRTTLPVYSGGLHLGVLF